MKYEPSGHGPSFQDIARQILERCSAHLFVVGPNGEEPFWNELKLAHPGRVQFHGRTAYGKMSALLSQATCYLDSIPYTGGTIFSEAAMSGLPVFGMVTKPSGYTVLDEIRMKPLKPSSRPSSPVVRSVHRFRTMLRPLRKLSMIARIDAVVDRFTAAPTDATRPCRTR